MRNKHEKDQDILGPAFLQWFVGFFDGEGHFQVVKPSCKKVHRAVLTVKLGIIDKDTIEHINQNIPGGKIYRSGYSSSWHCTKIDVLHDIVCPIFLQHQLHTKKSREFLWFYRAVKIRYNVKSEKRYYTVGEKEELARCAAEIQKIRYGKVLQQGSRGGKKGSRKEQAGQ